MVEKGLIRHYRSLTYCKVARFYCICVFLPSPTSPNPPPQARLQPRALHIRSSRVKANTLGNWRLAPISPLVRED